MFRKILISLNLILFFLEVPLVFSPEIKKISEFLSVLLSVPVCMRFMGIIGIRHCKIWGMAFLIVASGMMVFLMMIIKHNGMIKGMEIAILMLNMASPIVLKHILRSGL